MLAHLYGRFSPRPGQAECLSIENQFAHLRPYCLAMGWLVHSEHEDRWASGKSTDNRPGLEAAIQAACENKGVLVVYSLSRLARSTKDAILIAERLAANKAELACLRDRIDTTTATGRFFFRVTASLAELEREQISERTSDAMKSHQANGRRMSRHVPFGMRCDPANPKLIIENPDEQLAIEIITKRLAAGIKPRHIAKELETCGILCRGKKWHRGTMYEIAKRAKSA